MIQDCPIIYSSQNPIFDPTIIHSLKKAAKTNLVIFLGAGISMDVKLPSWVELLHAIAHYCSIELDEELKSFLDTYQYDEFLDWIITQRKMSEGDLKEIVASVFREELRKITADDNSIYSHLASLPSVRIITTNYDNLCARFMDLPVFSPSEFVETYFVNELMDSSWCLALHGMYNKPETIVLSKDSYERLYQENRFKQLFSHMTQSVRLLFLGFSFKDNSYVKNLVDSLGLLSATHYALVEYSNQHEKDTLEEALPFLSFQYYKPEFDNSQYSRRETVKRFISEIYSGMGPIIDPALGNEFEDAYRLFRRTTTVEKGIGKLYELEIRANGKQLPPKYSGYLMNARLREAFIRGDNDAIARFEKSIEGYSFTSTRYQLLISLGYYYINSGRYDKALEVLRECKQERPDAISPNLYCWCAEFKLGLLGNYENAIKEFVDDYGNITIDVSDDEKSNIFQIIGEMGLSNEATLADAEKFLNLALKFSPDAEIIEDLGFCYLKKVKYNFKKNHYVPTKELSVARAYFEEAMALCVDSIRRCYLRIAVAYLEVLEYSNLPMEYVKWFEKLKQYIRNQKDQMDRTMVLARFQSVLGIGITPEIGMFDENSKKRFYEVKSYLAGDYDSYFCLMQDRIDKIYKLESGIQKEYLFALFNAKRYAEFKSRLSESNLELNTVDREIFSALLAEIDDLRLAEEKFISLTKKYDAVFTWNELLAFYRRHHNLDALVVSLIDIQVNHSQLIGPDPSSFYTTFFYTILDDTYNPIDAYIILSRLETSLPEDLLWFLRMDLSQRVFCLSDTYALAKRIEETFAYKMNVTRERIAIIEYLIISLKFNDAERQMVEYKTHEDLRNFENSVIIQAYKLFRKQNSKVDLSMVNIDRFEVDVGTSLIFISRFPELKYIKDMKICLDLQTLAALYANGQIEYLLSAEEILINYTSMYQLFLLAANINGELLDNNLFVEIINWIIEHKDKIIIGGCSVDDYFNVAINPHNQKIFSLLQIDPYPEKIHILNQLPHGRIILMANQRVNRTNHPIGIRLGENGEIQILSDSIFIEYNALPGK